MSLYPFLLTFLVLGGLIILGAAENMRRFTADRRRRAVARAEAHIVSRIITYESSSDFVYEFFVDGVAYRTEFPGEYLWRAGKIVPIYYDPDCPEAIYIPLFLRAFKTYGLYFLGALWMAAAAVVLLFWCMGVK